MEVALTLLVALVVGVPLIGRLLALTAAALVALVTTAMWLVQADWSHWHWWLLAWLGGVALMTWDRVRRMT